MKLGTEPSEDASDYYDSLVLYGSAVVAPGSTAGPNTAALMNPHGLPMEIYEMRMRVYPLNSASTSFSTLTGLSLAMKLDLGSIAVSDASVPINGFSPIRDTDDSEAGIPSTPAIFPGPVANISANPSTYSWRLKYPLLVPSGAVLTPLFTHLGQNPFSVVVDIVYLARNLPPNYRPPEQVMVPWISAYNSNSYANVANAVAASEISSELAIVNPFDVPMEISRLVGSCSIILNGAGGSTPSVVENVNDFRFRLAKMSIRGSRGDEVARVPTPFNTLFPIDWRAWDIPGGWIFRPGEFYKFGLRVAAVDYVPVAGQQGSVQFNVTAIGYRPMDARTVLTSAMEVVQ